MLGFFVSDGSVEDVFKKEFIMKVLQVRVTTDFGSRDFLDEFRD